MNDAQLELINKLAEKLGATGEHLYGVLVRQAYVGASTDVITSILMLVIAVIAVRFVIRKTTDNPVTDRADWREENAWFARIIVGMYCLIVMINVLCTVSSVATAMFNPEYYALQKLLGG